jgi:enoyl-CoA hydratase
MSYNSIITHLENGVFTITINRPDKMNALNAEVIGELGTAIEEVYKNRDIRVAIITGAGPKAFIAGADISEFTSLNSTGGADLGKRGQDLVFSRVEKSEKPFIAAVNGFALGGGCELALSCHFRLASENAKFGLPEVNLGLMPGYGGTQRLAQLVGKGRAMEMVLTGNMISATDAFQFGLVNHVVPADTVLSKATELAAQIAQKAPIAVRNIMRMVNVAASASSSALDMEIKSFGELFDTADAKEGVAAFLEKRKAVFAGK